MTQPPSSKTRSNGDKAALYERIVDSATGFGIYTVDQQGTATSWNRGAEYLLGWTEADMLEHDADRIFTLEDRMAGVPECERRIALAKGRAENERWHLRRDGSRFWGSGLLMRLAGEPPEFVKILRDLTDRHNAEQQVRASEELFRVLATHIPQLVFQTRPNGERTWGSPQWVAFTGLQLEDSLGLQWLDAVHPDDREATQAAWAEAQATGGYLVEHRIRRGVTGEYRWHQTQARPIGGQPGDEGLWVGTSTDVHHLRGLQERQAVLVAELQHRTRNLLGVVQSIARQVIRRKPSPPEFQAEFGERLGTLGRVQNLLALTNHNDLDLRMLIQAELRAYADGEVDTGKVRIEGPPTAIPGEVAQTFALALHELTTNAVKYGALAQPSGQIAVSWRLEPEGEHRVVVEWRESGVTMQEGPRRKGYGSELIERALPYQLNAKTQLEFGPDGVRCTIAVPVRPSNEGLVHE